VATVNPHATAGEQHKYYVTVYDDPTKRLYVDDPKFIIGGGRRAGRILLEDIETLKQDTEALHAKYPDNAAIQKLLDAVEAVKKAYFLNTKINKMTKSTNDQRVPLCID
jgi:hypothetical protein